MVLHCHAAIRAYEEELRELNEAVASLSECIATRPLVTVDYFIPDARKEGGRYASKIGNARTIDQAENRIIFTDGESVPVKDMYSVVFIEE